MKTEYRFIRFYELPKPATRKTSVWSCTNKDHGDLLGVVKWMGAWRQYVFVPIANTIFSDGCLVDIHDFIGQLAYAQRLKVQERAQARLQREAI